jgi:hypothetical protein
VLDRGQHSVARAQQRAHERLGARVVIDGNSNVDVASEPWFSSCRDGKVTDQGPSSTVTPKVGYCPP